MEDFQPILLTRITMPERTAPCHQMLNDLFGELKKMRNVNVAQIQIPANWVFRHQCTVVGDDLTAQDVLRQIAHEFGSGTPQGGPPVQPGSEHHITWWLAYDTQSATYYLSMGMARDKTTPAAVVPGAPATAAAARRPAPAADPVTPMIGKPTPH
jgi:hypothetical protein